MRAVEMEQWKWSSNSSGDRRVRSMEMEQLEQLRWNNESSGDGTVRAVEMEQWR
jgi:hypothetical protein